MTSGVRSTQVVESRQSSQTEYPEIAIINLATGVVEKRLTFPGRVHDLTFTDDSRHLITGNANTTIYVVRLEDRKP